MASAADITTVRAGASGAEPAVRPNPVALEVAVLATGTRPAGTGASASGAAADASQRDLFVEETSTVLVFRDGAVIRLAAAVDDGQLVFLTNKQTKREVVCQVRRKRSVPPAHWYVELDFTEEMANFWGVEFPAEAAPGPVDPAKMRMNRAPGAAGGAAKPAGTGAGRIAPKTASSAAGNAAAAPPKLSPRPKFEDAAASAFAGIPLDDEPLREVVVEAPKPAVAAKMEPAKIAVGGIELEEIVNSSVTARGGAEEIVRASDAVPEEMRKTPDWAKAVTQAVLSGAARVEPEEERRVEEKAAEKSAGGEIGSVADLGPNRAASALEDELPKPELDFSGAGAATKATAEVSTFAKAAPEKSGTNGLRIGLLAAALLVLAAGAWYENWLPFLPRTKAADAGPVNVARRFVKAVEKKAEAPAADAAKDEEAAKDASEDAAGASNTAPVKKTRAEKNANETAAAPKTDEPTVKDAAAAADAAVNGSVIVPAKLVKSAQAVYPPDAMRNYITGDVVVDAEVKADGHVGEMKVLQGPAALREAAMDALKQYEYAPETKDGKAEASRVKVTVKFWFNP